MRFKAAIFDMDGLILDSERLCMSIFRQACEVQNVPFIEKLYLSIIGCNTKKIEQIFRDGYGSSVDYPALHQEWKTRYTTIVKHQEIPLKEGIIDLLEWLKSNSIPMAVATSTPRDIATTKLKLAGLDGYFDVLTTGCEVVVGKPDPEIYLLAAERLGVVPEMCLAFEDSNNGVRSAVAANMITFQIPDLVKPSAEVIELGHQISPSLTNILTQLKTIDTCSKGD